MRSCVRITKPDGECFRFSLVNLGESATPPASEIALIEGLIDFGSQTQGSRRGERPFRRAAEIDTSLGELTPNREKARLQAFNEIFVLGKGGCFRGGCRTVTYQQEAIHESEG